MKGNVIRLNIMHLNSVHLNSIGEVQSVSLKAGESTEDPVYPPTTYTLAANVSNGKVTATKNGTAISLPYMAAEGDVIVLSVTPDEGYEFNGWLDGNKSNPRTVTMTGNVVLSASCVEIAKPTYTLSASVTNGMVSATRNGSAVNLPFTANEGDVIVVEVTPNEGYTFEGWADGNTDNPRSITMNADVALSAQCVEVVQPPVGNYIQFEDKAVEAICVENWSSDGIGLTEEDAAAVTTIGNAFYGNETIEYFNEFEYFTGITRLVNPNAGATIKESFYGCKNLKEIRLPSSLTTIYDGSDTYKNGAFYGCSSLVSVGDMSHITRIGRMAFRDCSSFSQEINAPSVEGSIGYYTFYGTAIKKVSNLGNATILEGVSLASVNSPAGAFARCTSLEEVRLPATTEQIQKGSFGFCTVLKTIVCEATTPPTLDANAWYGSNALANIYVPDASLEAYKTATNWNTYADRIHPLSEIEGSPYIQFEDAEVERVLMANGVSSDGIGITKEDAENVVSIGTWFQNNTTIVSMNDLALLPNVTTLANKALQGCSSLTSIDLRHITKLGEKVFDGCTGLNGDFVAPSLESVATFYTFSGAQFKRYLDFGKLAVIPNGMFSSVNTMVTVVIVPTATTSIGNNQFYGDYSGKRTWVLKSATPCSVSASGWSGTKTFYVPDSSVDTYKAANGWSTFATNIKGISQLATDNPTLYAEIQQYL